MREPVLRLESERPSAYSSTAAGLLAVGQRRDAELGNHRLRNGKADDGGQQAGRADEADERLAAEDPAAVVGTAGGRHGIDDGRDEVERQHDEPVLNFDRRKSPKYPPLQQTPMTAPQTKLRPLPPDFHFPSLPNPATPIARMWKMLVLPECCIQPANRHIEQKKKPRSLFEIS